MLWLKVFVSDAHYHRYAYKKLAWACRRAERLIQCLKGDDDILWYLYPGSMFSLDYEEREEDCLITFRAENADIIEVLRAKILVIGAFERDIHVQEEVGEDDDTTLGEKKFSLRVTEHDSLCHALRPLEFLH